jgi:predicted NACHT family NTPase
MELSDAITITSIFAPFIYKTLSKKIDSFKSQNSKHISESISAHITEVVNWANSLDFFGVNPLDTNNMTIGLNLATEPRKFQSAQQETSKNELDLITEPFNILLLGEPGSGKSTTFKRLALHILQSPPKSELDTVQYPIVIRLRELKDWESLFNRIASIFGLSIVPTEIITRRSAVDINKKHYTEEVKTTEYRIDNERVQDVVATFLNDSSALVLLDGLDEMGEEHRTRIREDI